MSMVIRMDHHMDNYVDINVVVKNGYVWKRKWFSRTDYYGYSYGDPLGVNSDIQTGYPHRISTWIHWISTWTSSLDIQDIRIRGTSVEVISKSRFCMDMFGYVYISIHIRTIQVPRC
jgi:hypothetical protein